MQADVAQLVEQSIRNRQVIGSSPIVGSSPFIPGRAGPWQHRAWILKPRSGRGRPRAEPTATGAGQSRVEKRSAGGLERSDKTEVD